MSALFPTALDHVPAERRPLVRMIFDSWKSYHLATTGAALIEDASSRWMRGDESTEVMSDAQQSRIVLSLASAFHAAVEGSLGESAAQLAIECIDALVANNLGSRRVIRCSKCCDPAKVEFLPEEVPQCGTCLRIARASAPPRG
ncbi:MAG: hypothetical protein DHS20C21_01830 [Gemmatimonadota bacterium]|nr:MAG: hypothetical protein DHS20C21_01830 [Gemmatimonadota bacterium]